MHDVFLVDPDGPHTRFLDAGNHETVRTLSAPAFQKAPRHEVAVCWAPAGNKRYGDFDISAEVVCGGEADTPSALTAVGRLMDRIRSRGGNRDRRTLPQLLRFGMNVAQEWGFNLSGFCDFK
jgi:hypothetical protein